MISNVFREDIDRVISSGAIPWDKLKNTTVLITGATGLIGGALAYTLSAARDRYNIKIIAHGRDIEKGAFLAKNCGALFISGDIREPLEISDGVDYIFHCAAVTRSADMVARPVDVIAAAIDGTHNILELAREKRSFGVVYLSSMEVYGQTGLEVVSESDLGYLDLSNPRSSYPESKRLCENLCAAYVKQYGVPVKIARLARTFGAGVPDDPFDTRVAMQFARSATSGQDIILHTPGNSIANCCYLSDVVEGLLILLLKGENGESYNIANPDASMTVHEMAELVANEICGDRIRVVTQIPEDLARRGYAQDVGFRLCTDKIERLGWTPRYCLEQMYRRMLADWLE